MTRYSTQNIRERRLDRADTDLLHTLPYAFTEDTVTLGHRIFERYMQLVLHGRATYCTTEVKRSRFIWNGRTNEKITYVVLRHHFEEPSHLARRRGSTVNNVHNTKRRMRAGAREALFT